MKCAYCGAEFAGKTARAAYCSKRCKDNASKERRGIAPVIEHEKICPTCGGSFKTVYSRQIYCPDCRRGAGGAKAGTKRTAEERNPGFIFLSKNRDRVLLRCKKCGAEVERSYYRVKKGTVRCDACAYEKKRKSEALRLINTLGRLIDVKTSKVCPTCNKAFYSPHPGAVYCSELCKRKYRGRRSSMRGRCRKYGVLYRPGITLPQLYNRDGGVCQICGKKTDWMDNAWGANFGPLYPTIDHIVPLAKGGPHSWENVQLAHAICNSAKRDTIETAETA